jgi:hypothetical protein
MLERKLEVIVIVIGEEKMKILDILCPDNRYFGPVFGFRLLPFEFSWSVMSG